MLLTACVTGQCGRIIAVQLQECTDVTNCMPHPAPLRKHCYALFETLLGMLEQAWGGDYAKQIVGLSDLFCRFWQSTAMRRMQVSK